MANDDSNKVISLGNVKVLKDYIDKNTSSSKETISDELKIYLNEELEKASNNLSAEYEKEFKNLNDRIADVEANGTEEELNELKLQLDALTANFNDKNLALGELGVELNKLSGDYSLLKHGIETGNVFSAGQLNEIIKTALIDETVITDEMVSTPNVFTQKIVALIANFGHINAASIDAGTIKGSSIESINTIQGTNDPVWKIDNAGNGWLAKKNISWDVEGNVTFGPDVKIKWESVSDGADIIENSLSNYDGNVKNYIKDYVKSHTDSAVTQDELQAKYDKANDDLNNLNTTITGVINANKADADAKLEEVNKSLDTINGDENTEGSLNNLKKALTDALESTKTALTTDYKKDYLDAQTALEGAKAGLEKAIADGDEAAIKQFEDITKNLEWELLAMQTTQGHINAAVESLNATVSRHENNLDPVQMSNLIAASLVTETEVGSDMIKTPSLLAKEVTALLGTFGTVNANEMTANTIEGFTMSSPTTIRDENGFLEYEYEVEDGVPVPVRVKKKRPTWQLNSDGSGFIGRKEATVNPGSAQYESEEDWGKRGVTWDSNGNITMGDNVKIKWNAVEGGEQRLTDFKTTISKEYGEAIDTKVGAAKEELNKSIGENAEEIKNAKEKAAEISNKLNTLEGTVSEYKQATDATIDALGNKFVSWEDDKKLSPVELKQLEIDVNTINSEYTKLKNDIDSLNKNLDTWAQEVNPGNNIKPKPSELSASQIDELKISYDVLTSAKDAVEALFEYYSKNKDGDGCAALVDSHPLSNIPAYYAVQNEYIKKYQEVATEYLTNNRFGSKTTWIGSEGLYSGTISGDNIVGLRIAGLTVESGSRGELPDTLNWYNLTTKNGEQTFAPVTGTGPDNNNPIQGPLWQIYKDGSGHLAKGNISWNAGGTVKLGPTVKLDWSQVNDADTKVDKAISDNNATIKDEYDIAIKTAVDAAKTTLGLSIKDVDDKAVKAKEAAEKLSDDLAELQDKVDGLDIPDLDGITNQIKNWASDKYLSPTEFKQLTLDFKNINNTYDQLIKDINDLNNNLELWATNVTAGNIPSDLTADEIRSLKIDTTNLTTERTKVWNLYYTYHGKIVISNEGGNTVFKPDGVEISSDLPLSIIPAYYAVQNEYLKRYQEVASDYLANSRFGSKTTYIGSDGIYSGTISGDNIKGVRIAGLTVESGVKTNLPEDLKWYNYDKGGITNTGIPGTFEEKTGGEGPTWQIYKDGSGHLAQGNISWDTEGNMNCKVTGNFNGGNSGTCAGGAMTWDDNNIYINKNLKLGKDVSIGWGNVTGTDSITNDIAAAKSTAATAKSTADTAKNTAEQAGAAAATATASVASIKTQVESMNNFSKEEIESYATNITKDIVTTPFVNALGIEAKTIQADGLKAHAAYIGELAADNIVVKQLNTDPDKSSDKVEIAENYMHCINDAGDKNLIVSSNPVDKYIVNELGKNINAVLEKETGSSKSITLDNSSIPSGMGTVYIDTKFPSEYTSNGTLKNLGSIMYEYTNFSQVSTQGNSWYWFNTGAEEYDEIGYFFAGEQISVASRLNGINGDNSNNLTLVPASSWCMLGDVELILYVYKYNMEEKKWEWSEVERKRLPSSDSINYRMETIGGSVRNTMTLNNYKWIDSTNLLTIDPPEYNNNSITGFPGAKSKIYKDLTLFDIPQNGKYALRMKLLRANTPDYETNITTYEKPPYCIAANKSYTYDGNTSNQCELLTRLLGSYIVNRTKQIKPSSYTEIGKDGIIVYDGNNIMACYEGGVEMKALTGTFNNFFGFKVTNDGLYYCNGSNKYTKWTPS